MARFMLLPDTAILTYRDAPGGGGSQVEGVELLQRPELGGGDAAVRGGAEDGGCWVRPPAPVKEATSLRQLSIDYHL